MTITFQIKTRQTMRHGMAFDLYYRWKGKRYRPLLGYTLTPEEAQRLALDMAQKIQQGTSEPDYKESNKTIFKDVIPLFWNNFKVKNRIDSQRPRGIIDTYLLPAFGDKPLASLKAEDGLDYIIARQRKKVSSGTIRREMQVLNRILNLAVTYEKLDKNRIKAVELPEANKRERVHTIDELLAIQAKAPEELWRIAVVGMNVGLREGKILEIDRNWIREHSDGFWLHLPPSPTSIKGTPKMIPLNRLALAALKVDVPSLTNTRIFRRWQHIRAFRKMWATTCERAKVVDLHFHDLRHGFTTLLQELGVDYEVRQALLGHKMPGMTAHYSHGGPKWERKLRQAVTSLEKAFLSYGLSYGLVEREEGARKSLKYGEPPGIRTRDPRLKRAMLYHLS